MDYKFTIEPGAFSAFADEEALIAQCKTWGLLSDKAVKSKPFVYKRGGASVPCAIVGVVDFMTAVIEFENKRQHLIHPSLLKEMQAASYGQRTVAAVDPSGDGEPAEAAQAETVPAAAERDAAASDGAEAAGDAEASAAETDSATDAEDVPAASNTAAASAAAAHAADKPAASAPEPAKEKPAKKRTSSKPQLPEEKVKMTAVVKEFTTVPNHFAEEDDEVIVYEQVSIVEPELELGDAWSSHSNTLKKLALEVGDTITFEAKVVAKKLTKHPVPYKINNPSKLAKA
ncbi:hypothetical protein SAMN02799624_03764 [Paenibacillus sp. UNC496MF]|uniref:hypothetical protein n=1 Tax=Paenibacillus sp. UNC496MF TaxID=1502753 RepID=UPI0008E0D330|nr:hypothetical protein [Paenibacillus sp. UNC496MF]SFJ23712.1 hypothetical protein SAMN02799624_03764 [Paenibacillus sp. UNC496MF]